MKLLPNLKNRFQIAKATLLIGLASALCPWSLNSYVAFAQSTDVLPVANIPDEEIDDVVRSAIEGTGAVGVTLSIVSDGRIRALKGYGHSNLEKNTIVDPDQHLFRIGSITKTFTSTAIMQLVEKELIDLDANVNDYLIEFKIPELDSGPVRIRDLITHRSGFDVVLKDLFVKDPESYMPLEKWLKKNIPDRVRPAGQVTSYDNYGAALAGYIVQEVSGEMYENYVEDHIFVPLKMNNSTARQFLESGTYMSIRPNLSERVVEVYQWDGAAHKRQNFELVVGAPAGSISSTSSDMARYMLAHLNEGVLEGVRILDADTAKLMKTRPYPGRPSTDYTHGFRSKKIRGYDTFEHDGATFTTFSSMVMVPDLNFGVFVSVTGSSSASSEISKGLVRKLIGERAIEEARSLSIQDLTVFSGSYLTSRRPHNSSMKILSYFGGNSAVSNSGHGNLIERRNGKSDEYRPVSTRTFQRVGGDEFISFEMDKAGRPIRYYNDKGHEAMERMPIGSSKNALNNILYFSLIVSLIQLATNLYKSLPIKGVRQSDVKLLLFSSLTSFSSISLVAIFFLMVREISSLGNEIIYIWPTSLSRLLQINILVMIGLLMFTAYHLVSGSIKSRKVPIWTAPLVVFVIVQGILVAFLTAWNFVGFK